MSVLGDLADCLPELDLAKGRKNAFVTVSEVSPQFS